MDAAALLELALLTVYRLTPPGSSTQSILVCKFDCCGVHYCVVRAHVRAGLMGHMHATMRAAVSGVLLHLAHMPAVTAAFSRMQVGD